MKRKLNPSTNLPTTCESVWPELNILQKQLITHSLYFILVSLVLPDCWVLHMSNLPLQGRAQSPNLYIYAGLVGMALVLSLLRALFFFNMALNSSQILHDHMLAAVLRAPVVFFDTNPVGRVLNRFSRDLSCMDELLPETFLDAIQTLLFCVSAIVLPSVLNPWIILALLPLLAVFWMLAKYYVKTSRELRRLEALNRSPVFSHFSDTLEGLVAIRTYNKEQMVLEELYR